MEIVRALALARETNQALKRETWTAMRNYGYLRQHSDGGLLAWNTGECYTGTVVDLLASDWVLVPEQAYLPATQYGGDAPPPPGGIALGTMPPC